VRRILAVPIAAATTFVLVAGFAASSAALTVTNSEVSVGTPSGQTPRNHQNEPAVAIDAHNPNVLVAGSNDYIDQQPCPKETAVDFGSCVPPARTNFGVSGVYFSFNRGESWTQPTYTGWTGASCAPTTPCEGQFGPIGTLPWYYESNLVSFGDPAVAVGPKPGPNGFSWDNGSRVYYANLTANFGAVEEPVQGGLFKGLLGVAVSRLDDPTATRVQQKSSWERPVIVIKGAGTFALEDKEQIWADNAASSPFFGNVYTCNAEFRALTGFGVPVPVMVASSSDGGTTWTQRKIPGNAGAGISFLKKGYLDGCTIRTDSHGVVYLFLTRFAGTTTPEMHAMFKSFDGGKHWTKEQDFVAVTDPCFKVDPIYGRCVMDGYAGARIDLSAAPSVDIANGAPTGAGATNMIVDAWSDGRLGLNHEKTLVTWSSDDGATWHNPVVASRPADRSMYSAPAISPDGARVYVVYEGPTAPWRGADMTSPRPYHGVFRSATVSGGDLSSWATVYNGPLGDLRASYPGHDIYQERVGDYVYAAAARTFGVGVWADLRNAAVCGAVQQYRADSLAAGTLALPAPWPLHDCPSKFGNVDIWAATTG
jgi:hypothetical protein